MSEKQPEKQPEKRDETTEQLAAAHRFTQNRGGSAVMKKKPKKPGRKLPRGKPFAPGQSGNPGGRPKGFGELARQAAEGGQLLVEMAVKIIKSRSTNLKAKIMAAQFLADRGWGKAVSQKAFTGEAVAVFTRGQQDDVRAVLGPLLTADVLETAMGEIETLWCARAVTIDGMES